MISMRKGHGFTLLEVLVAMLVVLVGVLGAIGLSVKMVQQETESYQRVQALNLLQEMVDKLNANRQVAACYSNGSGTTGLTLGVDYSSTPSCAASVVTAVDAKATPTAVQLAQAIADLVEWNRHLQGFAAQDASSANVGALIGARGCIVLVDPALKIFRISVAWQGLGPTVAPSSACGKDNYGTDDSLRRTVNAVVRIGDLT